MPRAEKKRYKNALMRAEIELPDGGDELPLVLTDMLYEDERCLLVVSNKRCLCFSEAGELVLDVPLSEVRAVRVLGEMGSDADGVIGLEVDCGRAETLVFDIGDLEWSIYMLDQLLPEEDAEVEDEDLASSAGVGRQENISGRPPPGSTDGPASSAYLTDQLERLAVLHRQGLLTAEEFRIAKRNLLFPR